MSWKYNRTPTYVKNNFAKLNVYFEALNYETVEQKKAYEGEWSKNIIVVDNNVLVPGLLGDIGGQMGLFIGASIMTILELFDYVYEVIKVNSQITCIKLDGINNHFFWLGKIMGQNTSKEKTRERNRHCPCHHWRISSAKRYEVWVTNQ